MIAAGSSTDYRPFVIANIILSGGDRSIPFFFFDSFYLTSFAPILLGLDQLSPGLDNVVAGLIDEVLDAVHQLTLPCHIPEEEREKGGRAEERGMSGGEGKRWIASSKVRLHASMFRFARVRCVYGLRIDAPKEQNGAHVYARKRITYGYYTKEEREMNTPV